MWLCTEYASAVEKEDTAWGARVETDGGGYGEAASADGDPAWRRRLCIGEELHRQSAASEELQHIGEEARAKKALHDDGEDIDERRRARGGEGVHLHGSGAGVDCGGCGA